MTPPRTLPRLSLLSLLSVLSVLSVLSLIAACSGSSVIWDVPTVDRQIVKPWLVCADCTGGELAQVVATGTRLVPYLASALRDGSTLHDDSLSRLRAATAVGHASRYRIAHGPVAPLTAPDSLAATTGQDDEFRLTYRLRAAQALFQIDPARAAAEVARFCTSGSQELARQPQYKASFATLGPC